MPLVLLLIVVLLAALDPAWAQVPAPASAPAPEATADAPTFDVLEFEVEGNTVLSALAVEHALLPFMGPGRRLSDVEAARTALEKAFQDGGWLTVFVDLPEQRIDDGLVRMVVTEGRVDRVRVTGSRYFSQGRIRAVVAELQPGQVPNFNTLQAQVGELNRGPARQVQPVLRPGRDPGTVEAELKVTDQLPLGGTVELKNHHAADTEPWRLTVSGRWDNLFQRDHVLALTAITAPAQPSQSRVLVAGYTAPAADNRSWQITAVSSDSTLEPLGAGTVIGKGTTVSLRHSWQVFRSDSSHTLQVGADYKDLQERIVSGGTELSTPLVYMPFTLAHSGQWQHDARSQTLLNTSLSFAFSPVLSRRIDCPGNIGPVDQFACRRQGADGGFAVLRSELRHSRGLLGGTATLRLAGQIAQQPLAGGEQYSLGGPDTVRGYFEGEASGDRALLASAEWRSASLAPPLAGLAPWLNELSVAGFVDAARAETLQPLPDQAARVPLLGTGLGLRLRVLRVLSAELDLAWPMKATRSSPERDPRLHARVALQF